MNFTRIVGRFLSIVLFLFFYHCLPAQIRLAAEGGVHSSRLLETNSIPGFDSAQGKYFSSKTGILLGVLAEIPLGKKNFFFQPGINYSSKGNKYERFYDTSMLQSDTLYNQRTLKLNYVEIPLMLTYKAPLSTNGRSFFYLGAGPYFAFIYSASAAYQNQVKFYNDTKYTYNSGTEDLPVGNGTGKYKTLDIGIRARAGFELGNVMLGVYFSRGLSNAYQATYPSAFHHQVLGASLGIWLNKTRVYPGTTDTDSDGTPDKDDSCKTIAGPPRYHGCPVPDTDHDGVNDDADSCKAVAGLPRYHGCPIPDTDHDGLNDEEDSCKTIAGSVKYHGCPVPDTDGDGINDDIDQCITAPGSAEDNGCPPPVKTEPAKHALFVAQNVQFGTSSSILTTGSLPSLRELADTLKANPDLELTVEGHTDNSGSPEYNQKLSERRAEGVRKVLIKMGIAPERISIQGFGDTQPVGDNNTKEGKSKNRRVVFRLHVKNS